MGQDTVKAFVYSNGLQTKGNDLVASQDGGYLVVGSSLNAQNNSSDAYVLKLNSNFQKQYSYTYGSPLTDVLKAVVEQPSGDFIMAGYTSENLNNGFDIYLLSLNSQGQFLWQKNYGGSGWDFAEDLTLLNDGSMIVSGSKTDVDGFEKPYLLKVNALGDSLTDRLLEINTAKVYSGVQTQDSNLVFCISSDVQTDSSSIYIHKCDQNFSPIWTKQLRGPKKDVAYDIIEASSGNLFLSGSSNSHSTRSDLDIIIYSLSAQGDSLFSNVYATSYDTTVIDDLEDQGTALIELDNTDILSLGYTNTYGFGDQLIAFSRMQQNGNYSTQTPSPLLNYRIDRLIRDNQKIIGVGSSALQSNGPSSVLIIAADTISNNMFYAQQEFADTAVVSVGKIKQETVVVYPTFFTDRLTLKGLNAQDEVLVCDLNAKPVKVVRKADLLWFDQQVAKGAYIVTVKRGQSTWSYRVVKL